MIKEAIESKDWSALVSLCQNDANFVIHEIQKHGLLRSSRYNFLIDVPCIAISCILNNAPEYGSVARLRRKLLSKSNINPDNIKYLNSILELLGHSCKARKAFNEIREFVNNEHFQFSSLLYVESLFYGYKAVDPGSSVENVASVCSYLLSLYKYPELTLSERINASKAIEHIGYFKNIHKAHQLLEYRDIEILIDRYSVRLEKNDDEIVLIDEKGYVYAISWGYYKFNSQRHIRHQKAKQSNLPSFDTNTQRVFELLNEAGMYSIQSNGGFERFRLEIPCSNWMSFRRAIRMLRDDLAIKILYQEEWPLVEDVVCELHIDINLFDEKFIANKISIWDLIIFQRILRLLFLLTKSKMTTTPVPAVTRNNSFLLRFPEIEFSKLVRMIIGPNSNAVIEELTLDTDAYCDIQYTPIIKLNKSVVIPVGVAANSSIIRNTICNTSSRIDGDGSRDLIHEKVTEALSEVSIQTHTFKYSFAKISGDLDTVFVLDDCLYISENKNQLPGTSLHECLNVIEYYEKAKRQKEKFDKLWLTTGFKKYLEAKLNQSLEKVSRYHFFGTFGNRFFSQLTTTDFPLTFVQEITAFIANIPATIYHDQGDQFVEIEKLKWRDDGPLTAIQLSNYINLDRTDFTIGQTEDVKRIFNQVFKRPSAGYYAEY